MQLRVDVCVLVCAAEGRCACVCVCIFMCADEGRCAGVCVCVTRKRSSAYISGAAYIR